MSDPGDRTPGSRPVPVAPRATPDLAAVLGAAPLPLVLTTTDARVLFANRAMQRLIGVPVSDITGRFLAEFAGPPHGRLRRLAAVASSASHPITTEIALSLGRRRSVTVRVVVSRGTGAGGSAFLVWQVTTSPTAHALPEPPEGSHGRDEADASEAGPVEAPADPVTALAAGGDLDEIMTSDPHALTLEMIRTAPDRPVDEVAERVAALAARAFSGRPVRVALDVAPVPVSAVTDPVATLATQVEAELGGGPVAASAQGVVVVADLGADDRFGATGPEVVRRLGVRSVLAVPLRRGGAVVGSLGGAVYVGRNADGLVRVGQQGVDGQTGVVRQIAHTQDGRRHDEPDPRHRQRVRGHP